MNNKDNEFLYSDNDLNFIISKDSIDENIDKAFIKYVN